MFPTSDSSIVVQVTWGDFSAFLQRMRRRQGISQERLADLLGCHRISIWRLEHGYRNPSRLFLEHLGRVCVLTERETELLSAFKLLR